jgi:hypothetical protein
MLSRTAPTYTPTATQYADEHLRCRTAPVTDFQVNIRDTID